MTPRKTSKPETAPHMQTGKDGEAAAVRYLQSMGYRIEGRNIRIGKDEIDIVAFDPVDGVYVFVEVKARSALSEDFHPNMNVTWRKRSFMRRAAKRYMTQFESEIGWRLDVICVMRGAVSDHFVELTKE